MSDTTFTNGVTLTDADWFNDVNRLHYTIFSDPSNRNTARNTLLSTGLSKLIHGLTYANNGSDATNDIDIAAGGAMDATGAYWMSLASGITKQSDAAWAVGTNAGWLDTGAIGNNDYYIWLIARSDTGVVDSLLSLSSTAPTMPTNYDYKRLIGWIKRSGGAIVAFTVSETEGGGIEYVWTAPSVDVNLSNTLTTTRRVDTYKVPTGFSVTALIQYYLRDVSAAFYAWIGCPDHTDTAVNGASNNTNIVTQAVGNETIGQLNVKTSSTGTIAARASLATVDTYTGSTLSFKWARRN